MKKLAVIITLLLLLTLSSSAVAPTLLTYPGDTALRDVETLWQAVPTSSGDACAQTIWLDGISFSTGGTGRTVTMTDKQGSPISWATAVPLLANQITVISLPRKGTRLEGGFTIVASGSGVVYQFNGRIRR